MSITFHFWGGSGSDCDTLEVTMGVADLQVGPPEWTNKQYETKTFAFVAETGSTPNRQLEWEYDDGDVSTITYHETDGWSFTIHANHTADSGADILPGTDSESASPDFVLAYEDLDEITSDAEAEDQFCSASQYIDSWLKTVDAMVCGISGMTLDPGGGVRGYKAVCVNET